MSINSLFAKIERNLELAHSEYCKDMLKLQLDKVTVMTHVLKNSTEIQKLGWCDSIVGVNQDKFRFNQWNLHYTPYDQYYVSGHRATKKKPFKDGIYRQFPQQPPRPFIRLSYEQMDSFQSYYRRFAT